MLMTEGARLMVYDPKVEREQALREFADHGLAEKFDFGTQFISAVSPREAIVRKGGYSANYRTGQTPLRARSRSVGIV